MKILLRFCIASLLATAASLVVVMIVSAVFPTQVSSNGNGVIMPDVRIYSAEDLKNAEREAKKRVTKHLEQLDQESFLDRVVSLKQQGVFISWLPWLAIPFVIRVRGRSASTLLLIPCILVFTPLIMVLELFTFALALFVGTYFAELVGRIRQEP